MTIKSTSTEKTYPAHELLSLNKENTNIFLNILSLLNEFVKDKISIIILKDEVQISNYSDCQTALITIVFPTSFFTVISPDKTISFHLNEIKEIFSLEDYSLSINEYYFQPEIVKDNYYSLDFSKENQTISLHFKKEFFNVFNKDVRQISFETIINYTNSDLFSILSKFDEFTELTFKIEKKNFTISLTNDSVSHTHTKYNWNFRNLSVIQTEEANFQVKFLNIFFLILNKIAQLSDHFSIEISPEKPLKISFFTQYGINIYFLNSPYYDNENEEEDEEDDEEEEE
jgi:hypothetical protein